jgi:hypothetical protein
VEDQQIANAINLVGRAKAKDEFDVSVRRRWRRKLQATGFRKLSGLRSADRLRHRPPSREACTFSHSHGRSMMACAHLP